MTSTESAKLALAAFDQMLAATPGFRARTGQRQMAERIANTLQSVTLGEHAEPERAIAVIQAGTGVGKSAAYLSTTVAHALQRKTRVLVATATVALQEQLMSKDLPALAKVLDTPLVFALAKGRGRYVCKLKLERFAKPGSIELADLLELDERVVTTEPPSHGKTGSDPEQRRIKLYAKLNAALSSGNWNGERDSLTQQPDARDWGLVAAERHTCTARHCPRFRDCSYYQARAQLAQAQVIVANHDLVLASIGMHALPQLHNCLLVFDEGHHLPAVALNQFSASMDMSNLRWLDKLPRVVLDVAQKMALALTQDVGTLAAQLKAALTDAARLSLDALRQAGASDNGVYRFKDGLLAQEWTDPMALIHGHANGLSQVLEALGAELKSRAKEDPTQAAGNALQYARLGQLAPRLNAVLRTSAMLQAQPTQPVAKWLQSDTSSGLLSLRAHACPIMPGELLQQHLWSFVRGAVITSATLTSCGSFDYFLAEAGLKSLPHVSTLAVSSPFDYARQAELIVVQTAAEPRQVAHFTSEMIRELCQDLRLIEHGALVLFTSKVQMKAALEALDAELLEVVLVQGQLTRSELLVSHLARVESGRASVIFGMQSFGEGLDLPGLLCETVFIAKLPFASPSDPIEEARAEWLRHAERDPFSELVVPATGIRLLQWSGRAIRSENDQARIVCYDKRLLNTFYGRRMLLGLPPYRLRQRSAGVTSDVPIFA